MDNTQPFMKKWTHSAQDMALLSDEDSPAMSEKCLFLNIWTPSIAQTEQIPVMIWIHGGNFLTGGIRSELYNGGFLAAFSNVVVVTVQYRLGIFGIDLENKFHLGIDDQRAAISWINNNVHAFGGSRSRITLFGSGVGAVSVLEMVRSPPDTPNGMFQQIILHSYEGAISLLKEQKAYAALKRLIEDVSVI
ncbi:hypothetical protein Ciccas_000934 [Cichlidogyrus casuarinus]|uniref:Carboxylesterase type B domain-containing protein n=1 Tax=Cichlidogyrus casuarinus TaxID=1844966 RepID=A0ABD2QLH7_9PLAT